MAHSARVEMCAFELGKHPQRFFIVGRTCSREPDFVRAAHYQRKPETLLELPDRHTERGLRDVAAFGSPAEVQFLRQGNEMAQVPKLDAVVHSKAVSAIPKTIMDAAAFVLNTARIESRRQACSRNW